MDPTPDIPSANSLSVGAALLAGLCGGAVLDVLETLTPRLSSLEVSLAKEAADLLTEGSPAQRAVQRAARRLPRCRLYTCLHV